MELVKIGIPKSELLLIPENERIFFVQLTNLLNDLIILRKLIYFSSSTEESNDTIRKALNSQALFLLRLQAGKLSEGWQLLQNYFFKSQLSQDYENRLSPEGKNDLAGIKKYFNNRNIVSLIRNEFAFHYSPESAVKIKELINNAPDSEVFELFLAEHFGNCFCFMPYVLVTFAILQSTGSPNYWEAMDKLLSEVNQVTLWFSNFLGECIHIILKKYNNLNMTKDNIEIPDPPKLGSIILPYFTTK
jgi:hypothetical protein